MMSATKRIAVIGSTGQLGSDVVQVLSESGKHEVTPLSHGEIDVADRQSVLTVLCRDRFDVVVNCAAFTRVDDCEDRPADALRVNAQGAYEVARACAQSGALCVFISTDYVFDGRKGSPYREEDAPAPINVYGTSKLAGEFLVRQAARRWLILRIASAFGKSGSRGKGGNFIEAILARARSGDAIRVVNDVWMSPSYTMDVAAILERFIEFDATGLYHAANLGRCTWFEFASEAVRMVGLDAEIEPVPCDHYPSKAKRPKNSSMTSVRLEETLGFAPRPWPEALRDYLVERGHIQDQSGDA